MREVTTRGAHLTLTKVASVVGSCFSIQEVHCSKSISNAPTELILSQCAGHVQQQGDKMDYLKLMGLPRGCAPNGKRKKELFFALLRLSKSWKIMYLDWFPHGCYLAGLSEDTNASTGQHQLKIFLGQNRTFKTSCPNRLPMLLQVSRSGSKSSVLDTSSASTLAEG